MSLHNRHLSRLAPALMTALLGLPAHGAAPDGKLVFDVFLNDKAIGQHEYRFTPVGSGYELVSEANYEVRILGMPVYRYSHRSVELWREGCLRRIESTTDDDGDYYEVNGLPGEHGFQVTRSRDRGDAETVTLPQCVRTFAYWEQDYLQADALLNSQTGQLVPVTVSPIEALQADQHSASPTQSGLTKLLLEGDEIKIQVAYADGQWRHLVSQLANGRTLSYQARTSP